MTFVAPRPTTLRGNGVTLEPLQMQHADALFGIAQPETFAYFLSWPEEWTREAFDRWIERMLGNPKSLAFVVVAGVGGGDREGVVGATSYCDIDPANEALEIGWTWYAPAARGTVVNLACKLMLMEHAFETLGCVRVQLKCDGRNLRSQAAIAKLGAVREGVLRKHRIQCNGYVRDTVMYSVTREEWPGVKRNLEARCAAAEKLLADVPPVH